MKGKEKGKAGRKLIEIDYQEVERLAGLGLSEKDICLALGISQSTLTRKKKIEQIGHALKKGRVKAIANVSNKVYQNAMDGKETSAIFFLKNRDPDNWADRQDVNYKIDIKKMLTNAHERIIEGETVDMGKITDTFPKKKLGDNDNEE